jgi:hypothetical protein
LENGNGPRLHQYVSEFKDASTFDDKVLLFLACGKSAVAQERSWVTQYLSGSKHTAAVISLKIGQARNLSLVRSVLLQFFQDLRNFPLL